MLFLEKRLPSRSLWNVFRSELGALQPKTGIRLLDGILFIVHDKLDKKTINAAWILDIFRLCGVYQATLGVEMANFIRTTMDFLTVEDFRSKEVDSLFLDILSQEKDSGRLLILMHDCNVLAGVIPAFKAITCKVEYDSNHEYTIDQHILLALSALDNLKKDEDECIRTTFDFCKDKRLLRIAILLHDIGKGMPGDHVTNGSIIAEEMCDRLGLLEQEKRRVVFLVYNHLALSDLAFSRELEDHLVFDFAKKVGDADLLSMLYLLTVLDIRHVGYRTWTSWRAQLLMNAYEKIAACLQPAAIGNAGANSVSVGIDSELYTLDTLEEDRAKHHLWLSELKEQDFRIEYDSLIGFDRLTVLSTDRMGFFADITGCISSEGYNILSARAYSTYDGKILDVFNVEPDGITSLPSQERIVNIKKKWEQIRLNTATAEKMLQDRLRMYPPKKNRGTAITPSVKLDNNTSQLFTVLEIEAQDHFGLLYRITRVLSNHNINIVSARLSTRIDRAVDVFYLTDNSGQKLLDGSVFTAISSDLKDSLV
jgi:[protein-PII] uridylyltransferase